MDTTCSKPNICKTCDTFGGMGGKCSEIDYFPNATVAEYGLIELDENVVNKIKTELFVRGPVAATINGTYVWLSAVAHAHGETNRIRFSHCFL